MYVKKEYRAGNTIEIEKTYSVKFPPGGKRAKREKATAEKIKKHNEKLSNDYLRRLINHNYKENDLHIILTYPKSKAPNKYMARKHIKSFHAKMKKEMKKLGREYQYISITGWIDKEFEDDGENESYSHNEGVTHHHIIIKNIDYRLITKSWEHGRVFIFPLDSSGDYTELANYFIRHTKNNFRLENSPCKKRWSRSRNLIEPPPPKVHKVKASSWRDDPKPKNGYMVVTDSIKIGVSEVSGYPYQFYRMVKIPERKKRSYGKKMQI